MIRWLLDLLRSGRAGALKQGSLPALLQQIDRNLERVMVMEQRQFITMRLEAAEAYPCALLGYADAVRSFNEAFDEHHACAKVYAAELDARTRAGALVLDGKHEALRQEFARLKPLVLAARDAAGRMLEKYA